MNKSLLHVCLVAPLPPPSSGIGNWTVLVRRYAQSRIDVDLHIIDIAPRWRAIDDLALWKRVVGGGLQLFRDYVRFLRLLRTRLDVVHLTTHGQLAIVRDLAILSTARKMGIPAVYHLHFGRVPQIASENTREWRMLVRAMRMTHAVIAIDPATVTTIKDRLPGTLVLRMANGVDLAVLPASRSSASAHTLLYLGHVIPTKGVSELVQVWKGLLVKGWRCLVVGEGSEKYRRELLDRFRPEDLEFLPEQSHDDAMRILATSDVLVLPSHTEGFPNVIIEAMAMGKAIIASSVGAIPEMLAGECGVLVPPQDVEALRAALHQVLSDPDLRAAMGVRAQRKARAEYAIDKVFEQCLTVWRQAAETGRTR